MCVGSFPGCLQAQPRRKWDPQTLGLQTETAPLRRVICLQTHRAVSNLRQDLESLQKSRTNDIARSRMLGDENLPITDDLLEPEGRPRWWEEQSVLLSDVVFPFIDLIAARLSVAHEIGFDLPLQTAQRDYEAGEELMVQAFYQLERYYQLLEYHQSNAYVWGICLEEVFNKYMDPMYSELDYRIENLVDGRPRASILN